jgi:glycerol-3-phosphate acyltransferase PlsY
VDFGAIWSAIQPGDFLAAVVGYLLGSIPFGLVLTRLAGLGDVRSIGSGNIGATNVLRTGRKGLAAATLLGDALKGTAAVLIGAQITPLGGLVAGLFAFLGHLFPVWLGFRGGKGVATFLGVLAGMFWPVMLIFAAIWIAIAWFTRYSSLAALIAVALVQAALALFSPNAAAVLFALMAAIIWAKHHANIRRLLAGTENRIGGKT